MTNKIYSKIVDKNDDMYGMFIHPIKTLNEGECNACEKDISQHQFMTEVNELHSEAAKQESAKKEIRHSFRSVATDGKRIFESNFSKGTPKAAKSERILNLIQDVWSKKPINLVISNGESSRTILVQFDPTIDEKKLTPTDASKLAGGNRHGNHTEQRVTLDLADDYYDIVSNAKYNYSKMETGKSLDTHTDVKMWHYFFEDIYFVEHGDKELMPYTITINVKEKDVGDFVYSFNAEKESSTRQTLHADVITYKGDNGELFLDPIIAEGKEKVNPPDEKSSKEIRSKAGVSPATSIPYQSPTLNTIVTDIESSYKPTRWGT